MGFLADLVRRTLRGIGSRLPFGEALGNLPRTPAEILARLHSLWRSLRSRFLTEAGLSPGATPPPPAPAPQARRQEAPPRAAPARSESPPAPSPGAEVDLDAPLPELPTRYDESRVVLLPRDPRWLHAYWSLSEADLRRVQAQGGGRQGLRLLDVTGITDSDTPQALHDHFIGEGLPRHDLGASPNRTYTVQVGFWDDRGRFVSLARSTRVATPPAEPAPPGGEVFAVAPFVDAAGTETPTGTPLPVKDWPGAEPVVETAPAVEREPIPPEAPSSPDWFEVHPGFPGSRPPPR